MAEQTPAAPTGVAERLTPGYRRYALFVLTAVYCSSHVDRNILGILVEPIKADLGLSDTQLGFLSGLAFAAFYATLGIPVAVWADRGNRRNIIALAIAIWSAMTAVCGLAQNFWQLALARIGVGIGEAGSSPPSHSMIADLYPKEQRATAMAIFSLGIYAGILIGFGIGGWFADTYGWQATFFLVGLPGLLIALIVRYTLIEPPRGHADGISVGSENAPPPKDAFKHIWQTKTTRHIAIGMTLAAFIGYGGVAWVPAFLIRSHELSLSAVGFILAPLIGIVGGAGAYFGGWYADYLAKGDVRWHPWLVSIGMFVSLPFSAGFFLFDNLYLAFASYAVALFAGAFYLGPSFAMVQSLTPLQMRALVAAILLFVINIIGLGFGPQSVGVLSDLWSESLGTDSLRYALLAAAMLSAWTGLHYYLAARSLQGDMSAIDGKTAAQG